MEYRKLGKTETSVSVMSVGSWLTLDFIDSDAGLAVLAQAIDNGVTFFDDARYNDRTGKAPIKTGYTEVVFGELFRKGGWKREDVVIGNKTWLEFFPDESVIEETEGSLARLEMDYLDITYVVPPPKELPMAELVSMMNELVESGKVRHWGGLNWNAKLIAIAQEIAKKNDWAPFTAAQLPYNLLYRGAVEGRAMREICRKTGVSIVASYGLGGGILTNKYGPGVPQSGARIGAKELIMHRQKGALKRAAQLADVAKDLSITPAQLALAYCLKGPNVAGVVFGAKSAAQVEENLGAVEAQAALDDEALTRIRTLLKPQKAG